MLPRVSKNFPLFLIFEIETHTCTCMRTQTAKTFITNTKTYFAPLHQFRERERER